MKKAEEYVSAGGEIKAIASKYKLTSVQENKLVKLKIKDEQKGDTKKA